MAAPESTASAAPSPDLQRLFEEAAAGFRRFWPVIGLIAYAGYFDYKLNGEIFIVLLLGGASSAVFLFQGRVQPFVRGLLKDTVPERYRGILLAGLPAALLYLTRWKGTQDGGAAFLTMAVILGSGFVIASSRSALNAYCRPLFEQRDRLLPKPARLALVFILPVFFTFLIAHQNLGDLPALFGGETTGRRPPTGGSGFLIAVTAFLSSTSVFLLLNEPGREGNSTS